VVTANYIYHDLAKADNPITEIDYYANNALLGKLTYSYDTDGPIVGKGGSLATVNLPASTTAAATYNGDNTLLTWNGVSATDDDGQELTLDPSNSNSYDWNEYRSHSLRSIPPTTIPGACPEQSRRDALYRRESVDNYSVRCWALNSPAAAPPTACSGCPTAARYSPGPAAHRPWRQSTTCWAQP
jgi:hypothetical protein